jgi:TonB family protein
MKFVTVSYDVVPDPISIPTPELPPSLQGTTGRVVLQFVVGTNGRVEPNSIQVVSSTDPRLTTPSIVAIQQALYRPGQFHHQPVPVRVEQAISFGRH